MQVVTSPPVVCALSPYADLGGGEGKGLQNNADGPTLLQSR
jgi:hypothetical protein